jgi:hypothetical protein
VNIPVTSFMDYSPLPIFGGMDGGLSRTASSGLKVDDLPLGGLEPMTFEKYPFPLFSLIVRLEASLVATKTKIKMTKNLS